MDESKTWAVLRRLTRLATTLVGILLMAGAVVSPRALAAEPGTAPDITWSISRADVDRTVDLMKQAGVRWVRLNAEWKAVEGRGKGQYNAGVLAEYDYAVAKVREAGIKVIMPIADGVPYWASADPAKYQDASGSHWNRYYRPTRMSDYADYVRFIAARYSTQGVHVFEIWNEPNLPRFWPSGPNAAEYTEMLKAGYAGAHAGDPDATVLLGGLSDNDSGFLQQVYAAGGRAFFDGVADHTYPSKAPTSCWEESGRMARTAFCGIEEVRKTMVANGDSAKKIWITEFGWSTYSSPWGVTEAQQAEYLTSAFKKLEAYPYVAAALWYSFRNIYWLKDDPASWDANLGLLRVDFSPKPAYSAFKAYATAPQGSTSPPPPTAPTEPSPTKKPRPTKTRLSVASGTAARASISKRSSSRVKGRVSGARTGRVTVKIERFGRARGRWTPQRTVRLRLKKSGRFSTAAPRISGRWRVRASFHGTTALRGSRSAWRYVGR